MNKVYCKDCEHFWFDGWGRQLCDSPNNKEDSYIAPTHIYKESPQEKNCDNDCLDFKKKVSFFKRIFGGKI